MPRRSFKKRTFRKRRSSRKSARSARVNRFRARKRTYQTKLLRGPVNTTTVAKLRYCDSSTLTPAAGAISNYILRANDCYDIDYTSTGHQPMGFDQLMVNYNHFTVIGSKLTVSFIGASEDFLAAIYVSGNLSDGAGAASEIKERGRTNYRLVPCTGSNAGKATLRHSFSAKKFFHCKAIIGESQYKGTTSASPTEQAYYYVTVASNDGASTVGTVKISFQLEVIVVFSEPKSIGQS